MAGKVYYFQAKRNEVDKLAYTFLSERGKQNFYD